MQRIIKKIISNDKVVIDLNRNKQEKIMNKIYLKYGSRNMTYIQRSYCQYKCQMQFINLLKYIILNLLSILLILPFISYCLFFRFFESIISINKNRVENGNFGIYFGCNNDVIPSSLKEEFKIINSEKKCGLKFKDIKFYFREVFAKYPLDFYFNAKILYKIAFYSYNIYKYNPIALIVTSEYSYTSSILTQYCEYYDIKHINIMHGDKLYYIRDSFFKFHRCYVWNEHYINLFSKLYADKTQFILEVPCSFFIDSYSLNKRNNSKKIITYYLQAQNEKEMVLIENSLERLNQKYRITIRLHPLYTDKKIAEKAFKNYNIQYSNIDIKDSIINSDILISMYSTVLFQGYLNNKTIVIDDVTIPGFYEKLVDLESILVNTSHIKLSKFLLGIS